MKSTNKQPSLTPATLWPGNRILNRKEIIELVRKNKNYFPNKEPVQIGAFYYEPGFHPGGEQMAEMELFTSSAFQRQMAFGDARRGLSMIVFVREGIKVPALLSQNGVQVIVLSDLEFRIGVSAFTIPTWIPGKLADRVSASVDQIKINLIGYTAMSHILESEDKKNGTA